MTGEPSGSLFCFVSLPKRGQQKIHGCGTVLKIWRNPVLLKKMGALFGRGERRGPRLAEKGEGKKEKTKKFIKNFLCLFGMLIE